jgi:addiction module RelE/StbE family toxin
MEIRIHKNFSKQYNKLNNTQQHRAHERLVLFKENPYNLVLNNHSLKGRYAGHRSINITGDIRAVFQVVGSDSYLFVKIDSHSNLYKKKSTNEADLWREPKRTVLFHRIDAGLGASSRMSFISSFLSFPHTGTKRSRPLSQTTWSFTREKKHPSSRPCATLVRRPKRFPFSLAKAR